MAHLKSAEEQFLSNYNINDYDRPSVTTDIAVFSMFAEDQKSHRKDSELRLHLMLIRRGEHPYKDRWALPGGFLRADETVEECALRELLEETNITPTSLMPVGVFSDPRRDPRGRIISNAFLSIVSEERVRVMSGGDALNAEWFEVEFDLGDDGCMELSLLCPEEKITIRLRETETKFGSSKYSVESGEGLAFDHAEIIATALSKMRREAEDLSVAFDFLPESFTFNSLQRVQEALMGRPLLTANFRRKVISLLEETDEYTEGVGHRPARLFRKK